MEFHLVFAFWARCTAGRFRFFVNIWRKGLGGWTFDFEQESGRLRKKDNGWPGVKQWPGWEDGSLVTGV